MDVAGADDAATAPEPEGRKEAESAAAAACFDGPGPDPFGIPDTTAGGKDALADPDVLADPAVPLPTAVLFASDPAEADAEDVEAPVADADADAATDAGGGVKLMAFFPPGGTGLRRGVVLGSSCCC